ncbi:unnamed protein product, partial [Brassica rapa subsp. narinosa]
NQKKHIYFFFFSFSLFSCFFSVFSDSQPDQSDSPPDHDRVLRSDEDRVCNRCDLWCGLSWLLNRIYGSFEKPSEKEKGYVFPRADGENGENCHVRRLGRRASSAGILQRPNTDKNCERHDVLPKGFGAPGLP